ncbi:hypothetical protein OBBRIDRAFT_792192 [Obba rivulosa]|uniref:Alcohol acetyltransferase n=1 Tax=Obba rivulosa TaxID=1052685 RepID=A0A8E2AVR4_9APHY|nr:hypothetical protein OBBRIDRAFT_792192 [Obba rivulosa]
MANKESQKAQPVVVAQAGRMEQFHIWKHDLGMDSCVMIIADYQCEGVTLDQSTLFAALAKVVHRQPSLAVRFSSDRRQFLRLPSIDLAALIEFADGAELQDVLEAQLLRRFDTDAEMPLWRLVVINACTVVFAYQHALGDGQSGIAFHRALWTALNELEYPITSASQVVPVQDHIELVPPSEKLIDLSVSFTKFCSGIAKAFAPKALTKSASWSGNPIPLVLSTKTAVRLLSYTPQEAAKLLQLCKAHDATLTGLLLALAAAVLSRSLAAHPRSTEYKTIAMGVPITLRRFTGATADTMCNHVSGCFLRPPVQRANAASDEPVQLDDALWASAAQLTKKLHSKIATCKQEPGMLKFLFGDYKGYLEGRPGRPRTYGFELSNVGPFPSIAGTSSEEGEHNGHKWRITQTYFAQCDSPTGAATKLNAIGTPTGGLGLSVQWGDGAVDDSVSEALYEGVKDAIQRLLIANTADSSS